MRRLVTLTLVVAGVIHLLPLSGALGAGGLKRLYGLAFDEPNLAILMRHRAVLLGLVGAVLGLAVFRPAVRGLAFGVGLVSVASFLILAGQVGGYNAALARVVAADLIVLGCLIVGAVAHARIRLRARIPPGQREETWPTRS